MAIDVTFTTFRPFCWGIPAEQRGEAVAALLQVAGVTVQQKHGALLFLLTELQFPLSPRKLFGVDEESIRARLRECIETQEAVAADGECARSSPAM